MKTKLILTATAALLIGFTSTTAFSNDVMNQDPKQATHNIKETEGSEPMYPPEGMGMVEQYEWYKKHPKADAAREARQKARYEELKRKREAIDASDDAIMKALLGTD